MMSEKTTGYCGQHHTTISLDADCPGCEAEDAIREEYATQIGELEEEVELLKGLLREAYWTTASGLSLRIRAALAGREE